MPKRRANGEGNIRKRKDGRWEGRYTAGYDPETGKRIIKNVLGKTQAEVKEKLKAAISESQRLDVSKAGTYTVSSWMKMWYEVYAEPRIRPNTKAYYTNYIENHIIPGIGSIPLDKLTTIQIQRFYNNLQKSGRVQRKNFPELRDKSLSPRVVRGVHTLLHNCLEQAVAERLILANPAQGCKLPPVARRDPDSTRRETHHVPSCGRRRCWCVVEGIPADPGAMRLSKPPQRPAASPTDPPPRRCH